MDGTYGEHKISGINNDTMETTDRAKGALVVYRDRDQEEEEEMGMSPIGAKEVSILVSDSEMGMLPTEDDLEMEMEMGVLLTKEEEEASEMDASPQVAKDKHHLEPPRPPVDPANPSHDSEENLPQMSDTFRLKMEWEIALWAKLRGPGSTAFTELTSIEGLPYSTSRGMYGVRRTNDTRIPVQCMAWEPTTADDDVARRLMPDMTRLWSKATTNKHPHGYNRNEAMTQQHCTHKHQGNCRTTKSLTQPTYKMRNTPDPSRNGPQSRLGTAKVEAHVDESTCGDAHTKVEAHAGVPVCRDAHPPLILSPDPRVTLLTKCLDAQSDILGVACVRSPRMLQLLRRTEEACPSTPSGQMTIPTKGDACPSLSAQQADDRATGAIAQTARDAQMDTRSHNNDHQDLAGRGSLPINLHHDRYDDHQSHPDQIRSRVTVTRPFHNVLEIFAELKLSLLSSQLLPCIRLSYWHDSRTQTQREV
ncbi:hypothetical protein EDB83DRAFT_2319712 [Lactarius deliciosus]|nr:hypothetical protein EDB83DRAFT_2319712 [Lactarius deliciosus]